MGWRNIDEIGVPVDDVVTVRTQGGKIFQAAWRWGLVDDEDREAGGWHEEVEGDAPACWSDGICWTSNADGNPSDPVVEWK